MIIVIVSFLAVVIISLVIVIVKAFVSPKKIDAIRADIEEEWQKESGSPPTFPGKSEGARRHKGTRRGKRG